MSRYSMPRYITGSPELIELDLEALSRTRPLTLEESCRLEWAIYKQRKRGRPLQLVRARIEELELADKIEAELVGPSLLKELE